MKHVLGVLFAVLLIIGIGAAVERPRELSKKEVKQLLEMRRLHRTTCA